MMLDGSARKMSEEEGVSCCIPISEYTGFAVHDWQSVGRIRVR